MPKNPTSESETSKVKRFETGATGGFGIARPTAAMPGGTTGRFLVLLREGATDEGVTSIEKRTGKKLTGATKVLSTLGIESEQRPEGGVCTRLFLLPRCPLHGHADSGIGRDRRFRIYRGYRRKRLRRARTSLRAQFTVDLVMSPVYSNT